MKTGCPSANRDKVRGRPTGSSDEEPQRREEQPMRKYYVGLDVHSKKSAFVIEDEGGR
jgi:hypothetical protein